MSGVLIVFNYCVQVEGNKETATFGKLEALSIHGNILNYSGTALSGSVCFSNLGMLC